MARHARGLATASTRRFLHASIAVLAAASSCAGAVDRFEPDDSPGGTHAHIQPGSAPQVRDLEAVGQINADVDWISLNVRSFRSYEARITNVSRDNAVRDFERRDASAVTVLQTGVGPVNEVASGALSLGPLLRWQTGDLVPATTRRNYLIVRGFPNSSAASTTYNLEFRETTLFCPRFNNAGTQATVLVLQATAQETNACSYSAHFFSEAGVLLATQTGTLDFAYGSGGNPSAMSVHSLPNVAGLAGQKGAVQIAHTCGYDGIKAKAVALEPATGFSFDTVCSARAP